MTEMQRLNNVCLHCITEDNNDCECRQITEELYCKKEHLENENLKLKNEIKQEIQNTVEMERLAKKYLADFNNEYSINKQFYEFIEYVESVCKVRMTFENPNKDTETCLKFIDTTFDDLLIRINDLRIINKL